MRSSWAEAKRGKRYSLRTMEKAQTRPATCASPDTITAVSETSDHPLILYDGECNMCVRMVQNVLDRDPKAVFRFAALDSKVARQSLARVSSQMQSRESSMLISGGRLYIKSSAALAVARRLRGPWALLSLLWLVPYPIRDFVYDWLARNRMRWFGKCKEPWVPPRELRPRFLDASEHLALLD